MNYVNRIIRRILPKIKIHTWGGFGSQLYGVYLYLELERQLTYRRIQVVVHTSGITERRSEIKHIISINSSEILDYKPVDVFHSRTPNGSKCIFVPKMKRGIRKILLISGFLSESNSRSEFDSVKPWVLSLRGHYTGIHFRFDTLSKLYNLIQAGTFNQLEHRHHIGVHFRLGDLVTLDKKSPTKPELIVSCIQQIEDQSLSIIKLHSDSLHLALSLLEPIIPEGFILEGTRAKSMETLSLLINSSHFIGTTSKISVWVAIFRVILFQNPNTYMQLSFKEHLEAHGVNYGIHYY